MKKLLPCLAGLMLLFGGLGHAVMFLSLEVASASVTTYDLAADWSDAANPNGVWTYREGTNALPSVDNWTPLNILDVQPAWAPSADLRNFLPAWFKSTTNNPNGMDFLVGDVVVHSTDALNGPLSDVANVIWTSPINGVIDISGGVWMVRESGRGNHWSLSVNETIITGGDLSSADPFDRAHPFLFANGSGGAGVLNDIHVAVGDVIQLQVERTSELGDFVGVNFTINATSVPSLSISPPSGNYVTTQGFDLTLILRAFGLSILGGQATFDDSDVTAALVGCIIPGTLVSGGQTLRCPALKGGFLGTSTHTFTVTLDLSNGSSVSDSVTWKVLSNTEP